MAGTGGEFQIAKVQTPQSGQPISYVQERVRHFGVCDLDLEPCRALRPRGHGCLQTWLCFASSASELGGPHEPAG